MSDLSHIECLSYHSALRGTTPTSKLQESPTKSLVSTQTLIEAVRTQLQNKLNHDPNLTKMDDEFILKFLRARKMNIEETYILMCNYFSYRDRNKDIFQNLTTDDPLIKQALYDGFPGVLESRDRRGRCILVFFCSNWDHANYPLEVIYRSLLVSLERLINDSQNQLTGFVVIVDWTDMSLRQMTSLTPKIIKLMVEGLQDCFPARFKGVHFINQPWYLDPAITLLKAFLKEKMRKKIFVHGNNLSTLHEHVPTDILPTELGGEGPPFNPTLWADSMMLPDCTWPRVISCS